MMFKIEQRLKIFHSFVIKIEYMIYLCDILFSPQILPEEKEKNKNMLIKKIQSIINPENLEIQKLDEKKLFYPINKDDYLFLKLKTDSQKIKEIEQILRDSSFISKRLLINLDKEPKIKLNKFKKSEVTKNKINQDNKN